MNNPVVLHWFRRDLRLTDNTALREALAFGGGKVIVVPVYILSTWRQTHRWTGSNRQSFLCDCLRSLASNLEVKGSRLVFRQGDPVSELVALAGETKARAVFFNQDPDPYGREMERKLKTALAAEGIEARGFLDHTALGPDVVRTGAGEPFRVFTPFSRAWRKFEIPAAHGAPEQLPAVPASVSSLEMPTLAQWKITESPGKEILPGGERAARARMKSFLADSVLRYGDRRDLPAEPGTSRLSQDLRFGLLSVRELLLRCERASASAPKDGASNVEKYVSELIWREFYFQLLWHFPNVLNEEFSSKFRGIPWQGNASALERWKNGETGFPIIDAGMRELRETGFMHNRVRMITAMFLTKDLHVDWREGESWFMRHLVDGEIASNNGGWQWSAGTGADAAPYFRIQNPWTQSKRYDAAGDYIRRWIPELAGVSAKVLCDPPAEGSAIARGYPLPVVDHAAERDKTLEIFNNWLRRAG